MKIAFTADLHLRGKDLDACRAQLEAMVDECLARGVNLLAVAGDVFDRPSVGDNHSSTGAVAAVAIAAVKRLTEHGVQVLMIHGNHDQAGAGSADALHVFDGMDGVIVMREPSSVGLGDDCVIVGVSWSWSGESAERVIASHVERNRRDVRLPGDVIVENRVILLAHVQVAGARMSGSFTCEAAPGKWQVSREFLDSLPVDHIALGDFHARQTLVEGRGGYVGALRQCNFGEEGNPAGFEVYNTETGVTEWVELGGAPKHRTLKPDDVFSVSVDDPDYITRVRYENESPDPVVTRQLEALGVQVEQIIEREERIRRADVPDGVLSDRHGLIRLWAEAQHPPVDGARLERMGRTLDGLYADNTFETAKG